MGGISLKDRMLGGLWGAVVGDALGVPVELIGRGVRKKDPVLDMRGYGTYHQPPGTWSDDSSLLLCTAQSLLAGFDLNDMAQRFVRWRREALWTPWGEVFDVGGATDAAICRIERGVPPEAAGGVSEKDNGNGSLMRIMPVGLRFALAPMEELLDHVHRASAVTHRHHRSQMACGIYCLINAALLKGVAPAAAYASSVENALVAYERHPFGPELFHFQRFLSGRIQDLPEPQMDSGGYVVHTLEASVWCLLNSASFSEAVLKAVNLGGDTDTTGCVAGGLAGICYGLPAIPRGWIDAIVRKDDIEALFVEFCGGL